MRRHRSNWLGVNRRVRKLHKRGNLRMAAHQGLKSFRRFQRWYSK